MMSALPNLFEYGFLAPTVLRAGLGAILLASAAGYFSLPTEERSTGRRVGSAVEAVIGVLLVVGMFTQIAAAVAAITATLRLVGCLFKQETSSTPVALSVLSLVVAVSLLVLGPGAFAIDLPL